MGRNWWLYLHSEIHITVTEFLDEEMLKVTGNDGFEKESFWELSASDAGISVSTKSCAREVFLIISPQARSFGFYQECLNM